MRASAARLAIRAAAGGSAPSRGGPGGDWGGRGTAPHCRRRRGLCAPWAPGWLRWAPGAGAAALEAEAPRELRSEAGRGRDEGAEGGVPGVLTPPPPLPLPAGALRLGSTHTLERTPAPGTRPRLPHAGSPAHPQRDWPARGRSHSHAPTHIPPAPTSPTGSSRLRAAPRS